MDVEIVVLLEKAEAARKLAATILDDAAAASLRQYADQLERMARELQQRTPGIPPQAIPDEPVTPETGSPDAVAAIKPEPQKE